MGRSPLASPKGAFALLVCADFSAGSDDAVDQAARIASRIPGSQLHVVQAVDVGTSDARVEQIASELETYVSEMTAALGIELGTVAFHVRAGAAPRTIAALAREVRADLIVLGARRVPHLRNLFIGSIADRVLRVTTCPVMVASKRPATEEVFEPTIEPPCEDCAATRVASEGAEWWCARHAAHHVHGHAYRYQRALPLAQHDSAVLPTGAGDDTLGGI